MAKWTEKHDAKKTKEQEALCSPRSLAAELSEVADKLADGDRAAVSL